MPRIIAAVATAFALALAVPALAADCHGDCANCPHKAAGADKGAAAPAACGCAKAGGQCSCKSGCKCEHCAQHHGAEGTQAPQKAPAKT